MNNNSSKLIFLGTGTSSGVPVIGCDCNICTSNDPHDKRLRTSVYITTKDGLNILIDVSPDFRQQALQNNIHNIDALLITHSHYDHVGGIDELRQINFLMGREIDLYGNKLALDEITRRFDYLFKTTQKGGGKTKIVLHEIKHNSELQFGSQKVVAVEVMHGKIPILAYLFPSEKSGGLAYITDASFITDSSLKIIKDTHPDILVINALRERPHQTHFSIDEALEIVKIIEPKQTYFIHLASNILHKDSFARLPDNVVFAYDNLEIEF